MGRLEGRVAVITGAGSGIGRATAEAFAREGARLVLCDVRRGYLDALAPRLAGNRHELVVGDVALEQTAAALASRAREAFGRLDVLVGCVGLMFIKDVTTTTVAELDRLWAVNVRGTILICKHALPQMLEQGSGSIVIISSGSAFRGQEFDGVSTFAYNITKAAVRQLATSLATRYARDGIRANAVAPGVTRTSQLRHALPDLEADEEDAMYRAAAEATTPLGRCAEPEEIARAVLFLAGDDASFVSGETLVVDGGLLARL